MNESPDEIARRLAQQLEDAWNAGDGRAFGSAFSSDADFVNIRGEHNGGRGAIVGGNQAILDTVYRGSRNRYELDSARSIDERTILAHVKAELSAPSGPLAGVNLDGHPPDPERYRRLAG